MARKTLIGKSLAEINPKLADQWHPIKNGKLNPFVVSAGSHLKVWWKCPVAKDHEWESTIKNRSAGNNCPICSGKKIVESNCLATLRPDLAKEFHPKKNGLLTVFNIGIVTSKKVWWKCPKGDDHEWLISPKNRSKGNGCPFCANLAVSKTNSFLLKYPELSEEWHHIKNGNLKPIDVVYGSTKKVWWKCPKGDDHVWEASPLTRSRGHGCPVCVGQKVVASNSLTTQYPEIARMWHPVKNDKLTPEQVTSGTTKKVWWKCPKGDDHEWKASIASRVRMGRSCPICSGQLVVNSNSLQTKNPKVLKYWHPTKNGSLTPSMFTSGTRKKVWWKCPKGDDHEWEASIVKIVNGAGCPICSGQKVVESNSLSFLKPRIAMEWHQTKNMNITPDKITTRSNQVVWWQCSKDPKHEWKTSVYNRTKGTNCPYCTLTPQSKQELQITFELKQFFNIDPKGFKTRVQGKLWSIDIYLQELNLGIEFDGSYWHKDKKDLDKLKTEKLNAEGFQIMRIREEPLKPITEIDVVSKLPFNAKQVANDILVHIIQTYELDKVRVQEISKYLKEKGLKNEKALDEYIEMILDEKSEKKQKRTTTAPKPH